MSRTQTEPDLETLKLHAQELWDRQQEVFAAAGRIAREAGQQGAVYARDEVAPRVRQAAAHGAGAVQGAVDRVLPVASSTLATVAALGDTGVRELLARLNRARRAAAPVVAVASVPARKGLGVGGWIGVTVGVIAAGAIAYAVWQTLRADDDLWIEDDEADATPELAAGE